uniref:KH-like RNA-binding domain-containing protein n=1 Tax=Balaenoptera musculus TaxID=9771 RepID=A0A8C0I3C3_BALMU
MGMGKLPERNDIPPWVGAPEVLKEPGVFQVQTGLLEAVFRPDGSRIPFVEQVSKVMLQMKGLETSDLAEVMVYGSYLCKFQTKWVRQSVALTLSPHTCLLWLSGAGMVQPEEVMNSLDLASRMKGSQFAVRPTWGREVERRLQPELQGVWFKLCSSLTGNTRLVSGLCLCL